MCSRPRLGRYGQRLLSWVAGVVHYKGVPVHRHVAAGQDTEVNSGAAILAREQGKVELAHQLKPIGAMGVHALTQGGTRWHSADAQGPREKIVAAKGFNGVKVVLALHQQTKVAFEDVAVGDTFAREGILGIDALINLETLEILADECQAGVGSQLVGQFFDNKVGHVGLTFRVSSTCGLSA